MSSQPPVIALHGTSDTTNPYDGGGQPDWQYSVPQAGSRWAELLGCQPQETVTALSPNVDLITHAGCRGYSTIALYRVRGGQHVWFDGEVKTSEVVTSIIERYALVAPRLTRFSVGCRKRKIRVRTSAATDSPLAKLTIQAGRRRRTFTKGAATAVFPPPSRRSSVRVTAVDKAGLSGSRSRKVRCPA